MKIPSNRSLHLLPLSSVPPMLNAHVSSKAARDHNPNCVAVRHSTVRALAGINTPRRLQIKRTAKYARIGAGQLIWMSKNGIAKRKAAA